MPVIKVQNQYETSVTEAGGILDSGDVNFTVGTPPVNTNGWLVVDADNVNSRELMYYHDVIGSRIYVRSVNRSNPKLHSV